jgi:hypothetical protein
MNRRIWLYEQEGMGYEQEDMGYEQEDMVV